MASGTPLNLWGVSPPGWARRRASAISTFSGCPVEPKKNGSVFKTSACERISGFIQQYFCKYHIIFVYLNNIENGK